MLKIVLEGSDSDNYKVVDVVRLGRFWVEKFGF